MKTLAAFLMVLALGAGTASAQTPEFQLGFRALADQIPDVVGVPLESEHWGTNGDSLQRTTRGLMVWRKTDNWTAFTDGSRTWINGPNGVQWRTNDIRFRWEGDYETMFAKDLLPLVINDAIGWQLKRIEKITVSETDIYLEVQDSNWVGNIIQHHQYMMLVTMGEWMVKNVKIRPNVTIRSNSYLSANNYLESVTSGTLLERIANHEAAQSDWNGQAQFKVVGELLY